MLGRSIAFNPQGISPNKKLLTAEFAENAELIVFSAIFASSAVKGSHCALT